jgi:hypothetical protein
MSKSQVPRGVKRDLSDRYRFWQGDKEKLKSKNPMKFRKKKHHRKPTKKKSKRKKK